MNLSVTGFAHVGVRVHELERSQKFYEMLGFELVAGPMGPEPVAILKNPAGVEVNLVLNAKQSETTNVLMDNDDKHPGYTHVALEIESIEDAMEVLEEHGVPLSGGPMEHPWGARAIFVRDPDRNVLELFQPAP